MSLTWYLMTAGALVLTTLSAPVRLRMRTAVSVPRLVWVTPGEVRGTPVADASSIYVRTAAQELLAVDRATGAVRWKARLADAPGFVSGGRLLLAGDLVIAGTDDVEAFRRRDGARIWRANLARGLGAGVQLGGAMDDVVFAGSYAGLLLALDVQSGSVRWAGRLTPEAETNVFVPSIDDDRVVATFSTFRGAGEGGLAAFDRQGHPLWRARLAGPDERGVIGPAVPAGDVVLAADRRGTIAAVERDTGAVRWRIPRRLSVEAAEDFRPMAVSGSRLVVGSLSGEIVAYDLATQHEQWRAWPSDASVAFGMIARDDVVYVPYVSGRVVALDARNGRERWRLGERGEGFRWVPWLDGPSMFLNGAGSGLVAMTIEEESR
jgi:outer membrane protein assembly factor BamB